MKVKLGLLGLMGSACAMPMESKPDYSKTSDAKTESIPYKTLEKNTEYGFDVREYPASKWVCSTYKTDTTVPDPFEGWEDEEGVTAFDVMGSAAYEERPQSKTFMRLFKYILGVNSEGVEIDMTRPVTTKVSEDEDGKTLTEKMCFWTGSPWADKDLPKPLDKRVEIEERPKMQVYVHRFSGWAIKDSVWEAHTEELAERLANAGVEDVVEDHAYMVGYDGPWTMEDRRNEVWMEKKMTEEKEESGNKWKSQAFTSESKTEKLKYTSYLKNKEFELRKYPKTKWTCTKMENVDGSEDVLNGWMDKFEDGREAMRYKKNAIDKDEDPTRTMFMRLFQYIAGVNEDVVEIDMTSPATTKHEVKENEVEDLEMCFWSGEEWANKDMPKPLKKEVYLKEKDEVYVYVRKFGGWAMSYEDWHMHYEALKTDLGERKYEEGVYITAGYNSPWVSENRRNEVWIPVAKEDIPEDALENSIPDMQ